MGSFFFRQLYIIKLIKSTIMEKVAELVGFEELNSIEVELREIETSDTSQCCATGTCS